MSFYNVASFGLSCRYFVSPSSSTYCMLKSINGKLGIVCQLNFVHI